MGKLLAGSNWFLAVRIREHFPVHFHFHFHFHFTGPDFAAMVDAETLKIIEGDMPRAVAREVMEWAQANRAVVIAEWNRCNPDLQYTSKAKEQPDE